MSIQLAERVDITSRVDAPRQESGQAASPVAPLVTVAIACYNQARFLAAAIESVLAQSYRNVEVIVVDDGSTDDTAAVVAAYPSVQYVWQENGGLSAARNAGLRHARGEFIVFLDADDRLLPRAAEVGVLCLTAYPECAFASGHFRYINEDGSFRSEYAQVHVERDHYLALLRGNYIGMHAAVIYRRRTFEMVGGFDTALRACEDYDLYLRITRQMPVFCHDEIVAEYRQHGANMSGNPHFMLTQALGVLQRQRQYMQGNRARQRAYRFGRLAWQAHYGRLIFAHAAALRESGEWQESMRVLRGALRQTPLYSLYHSAQWLYARGYQWLYALVPPPARAKIAQGLYQASAPRRGSVQVGTFTQREADAALAPSQRVDQHYIDRFVAAHAHYIQGDVLHLGRSTERLATDTARMASYERDALDGETLLENLDHLQPERRSYDCILLLDVLPRVYDLHATVATLYGLLKPGGVLLATLPGIGLVKAAADVEAGYWSFTATAARQLFGRAFPVENLRVAAHGNVLAATALLHEVGAGELSEAELAANDPQYPVTVTVRAIKEGSNDAR